MNKAEGFGLGVDFGAGEGRLESGLGSVDAVVHNADCANGNHTEDGDGKHNFDKSIAFKGFWLKTHILIS